ncbi:EVE domain-containing protein [bacterium]|nr:EVE domain-containing protein [bacterium]MBU1993930.1 EVE domain-containing protein [bacterium]
MTVDDYLRSVGKKCFIDYYELFRDLNIDRQILINTLKKEGLSPASCDTKASDGRQIFIKGLEVSALRNIIGSQRLEIKVKEKAQVLLNTIGFKEERKYWIISSNPDVYDFIEAFKTLSEVDWGNASNNHINVGDIVYIYITQPEQRIAIKTEVTKSDFDETELLGNDGQFNKTEGLRTREKYFRLKLIEFIDNDLLRIEKLQKHGINGNIQGKRKLEGESLAYILYHEKESNLPDDTISI